MSKYKWASPEKPQPDSVYSERNVWYIAFKPLDTAILTVFTEWVVLSEESFGSLYSDEGGILKDQEDKDRKFWRAIYAALIKQNANISSYIAVPGGLLKPYKYQHAFLNQDREAIVEYFQGVHDGPADYILISDKAKAHEEEAIHKATTFLDYVSKYGYPYSYMVPLLENYQQILWTDRSELYLLTRINYFSRDEIKSRLSEAILPFGLTLPKFDWIIAQQ